ncbi:SlyX family protein [Paraburkholderia adhaesiva]|uniref:SlyX family protein n=1 Tax=Paraburkholderia adhaesiva TaxID=2883244 RepID=UPI001F344AE7|nr:SlyX family protein [Paraburkholderia adhaesiva]
MFDKLKGYTAVIIGTVVFALVASLVAYGAYQAHKVKALNETLAVAQQQVSDLQAANRNLTQQVQLAQTLNRVNDEVVTTAVQDKADMTATQGAIASSTKIQIENVKKKYEPEAGQMKTQEAADAQTREISAIEITGLWQLYCQVDNCH